MCVFNSASGSPLSATVRRHRDRHGVVDRHAERAARLWHCLQNHIATFSSRALTQDALAPLPGHFRFSATPTIKKPARSLGPHLLYRQRCQSHRGDGIQLIGLSAESPDGPASRNAICGVPSRKCSAILIVQQNDLRCRKQFIGNVPDRPFNSAAWRIRIQTIMCVQTRQLGECAGPASDRHAPDAFKISSTVDTRSRAAYASRANKLRGQESFA